MQAVIMAGGVGQRLRPLTCTLPKPMVPVMNRPVMEYSVQLLKRHGIENIAVTLQYLPDEIRNYFGDGSAHGVDMTYFVEDAPLGTAGSVRSTRPRDTFIVVSGDALTDINLEDVYAFHREKGSLATLVLKKVDYPLEYGVVLTDAGGRIERFLEKPGWGEVFSDLANTGIYILEQEVFEALGEGNKDFAKDLFPALLKAGAPLFGYVTKDYWCDIGDLTQYLAAHRDIFDGKCRVSLEPARYEGDGVYVEPGACIEGKAVIKGPCYIGAGAVIEPGAALEAYTVLGSGAHICKGASVKRSVIWNGAVIEAQAEIRGAVVCDHAVAGAHSGAFEGAVLGTHSILGEYAQLKPNVCLWPYKRVEAHQTRSEHLVWQDEDIVFNAGLRWPLQSFSPGMAARLGCALSALAGKSAAVACDGSAGAVAARMAVMSGLMARGTDVMDFGVATLPMLRFGQRMMNAGPGFYISGENAVLSVTALDKGGVEIPVEKTRKCKQDMMQDGKPVEARAMGLIKFQRGIAPMYSADVTRLLNMEAMRGAPRQAVVGGASMVRGLLTGLLTEAYWKVLQVEGDEKAVGTEMQRTQADIGLVPTAGDKLDVIAQDGSKLPYDTLQSLLAFLVLQRGAQRLVLPMRASEELVSLARRFGANTVRVSEKTLFQTMMEQDIEAAAIHMDACAAAMHICQILSETGEPLEKLLLELPQSCRSETSVNCSWRDIGKIFRTLVETQPRENLDLLEGVRVRHEKGWALVMPDVEAARCRILCESASEEYAESLTDMYAKKIQEIVQEKANESS